MCATSKKKELRVLCINPWIYDFTAFDLWSKPLGLLYIAGLLKKAGVRVDFIDCLDKWHPELLRRQGRVHPKLQKYGTGHFHRDVIQKPACFHFVPRYYARYGLPEDIFIQDLQRLKKPDAILVTSIMTYWYSGPQRVVEICRSLFPGVPIVLGGIYATLMPDHARKNIQPDYLIEGPGEYKIIALLASLFNRADLLDDFPNDIDAFPPPAFELLHHNDYYVTMTSRGCPFRCTFCATYKVDSQFTQRKPEQVCHEIITQTTRLNVRDVVFYDDALLMQSSRHIKPLQEDAGKQ